ncbi:MAG: DUF1573 domain-containing protein [Saprospiraceae bacterium]
MLQRLQIKLKTINPSSGIFFISVLLGIFQLPDFAPSACSKPPQKVVEWLCPLEHDFGILRQDHPATYVFSFKNVSGEQLILQTVRTTCGCTAADWTEAPIEPDSTGQISIEYDAYQRGDFSKKIRVFFDKQRKAEILKIYGTVK